jgi:hypothetical protein
MTVVNVFGDVEHVGSVVVVPAIYLCVVQAWPVAVVAVAVWVVIHGRGWRGRGRHRPRDRQDGQP